MAHIRDISWDILGVSWVSGIWGSWGISWGILDIQDMGFLGYILGYPEYLEYRVLEVV